MKADQSLDCFGLLCPVPIIQTAQRLKKMKIGEILEVISTDKGIREDLPAWCRQTGQQFIGVEEDGEVFKAYVKKVKVESIGIFVIWIALKWYEKGYK
jgi:tRNA 2-thiouridine synthesizing protein A